MKIIKASIPRIVLGTIGPILARDLRFPNLSRFREPDWMGGRKRSRVYWSKSNAYENALMLLVFNNMNIANIGDATGLRGSSVAGSLYLSLHTADPGEAGAQNTSEVTYTSYARVAVARASGAGGWTVAANAANPTDALTNFPAGTGGSGTATYFGIGSSSSGAGLLLYSGEITTPGGGIVCGNAITPQLTSATTATED